MSATLLFAACEPPLDTNRTVETYSSFGEAVYREACQRTAYIGQLEQKAAGSRQTVDVAGGLGRTVCVRNEVAPADAPAKLQALQVRRTPLIGLVDLIAPDPLLTSLQRFLEQLLPLTDDGTMGTSIRTLGELLGLMRDDQPFSESLARLAHRTGYRPPALAGGVPRELIAYPGLDEALGSLLGVIGVGGPADAERKALLRAAGKELANLSFSSKPTDPERTARVALNLLLAPRAPLATGRAQLLALRDHRGFAVPSVDAQGKLVPPFVDTDGDGLADVDGTGHFVDAQKRVLSVATPFAVPGETSSAPRDSQGRALVAAGSARTLYQYLDLDTTVLGALVREAPALLDGTKDIALGLLRGAAALLGPRATLTKSYSGSSGQDSLTYEGYDPKGSALLDLLHGFIQILGDPNVDKVLQVARTLLVQHESKTARVVGAMLAAAELGKRFPDAVIPATSTLFDQLIPIITRTLQVPGLTEDLLDALENPQVKGLAGHLARQAFARNQVDFDHTAVPDFPLVGGLHALDTLQEVDRTKPDVDYNRSLLQRIAHLIHSARGLQFCNREGANPKVVGFALGGPYPRCEMFRIDDLALFYVLNMASDGVRKDLNRFDTTYSKASFREALTSSILRGLTLDNAAGDLTIQVLTKINGFTRFPAPAALNRSLFLTQAELTANEQSFLLESIDPVRTIDGELFIEVHNKSIFAWEMANPTSQSGNPDQTFYQAIQPVIDAFAKHDECLQVNAQTGSCAKLRNAAAILVDLFSVLHEHWASPKGSYFGRTYQSQDRTKPRFAYTDNVVSYEPLLSAVLQGDLVPSLLDLVPTLNRMTVTGGTTGERARPVLLAAAQYLLDPAAAPPSLTTRSGSRSTTFSDGKTPVPQVTPFYLIADAQAKKRAALEQAAPETGAAWRASTSALVDELLTVEHPTATVWSLKNRRAYQLTLILLDFMRERLAVHKSQGDLDRWVRSQLTQDVTEVVGGPLVAALADLGVKLQSDATARGRTYELLQFLVDETRNERGFAATLTTLADLGQLLLDDQDLVPLARIAGKALDPDSGTVDAQLTLVQKGRERDDRKVLLTLLRNLYEQEPGGLLVVSKLADLLAELNRVKSGAPGELDAADYRQVMSEVSLFLLDQQRGFARFVEIAKRRVPTATP